MNYTKFINIPKSIYRKLSRQSIGKFYRKRFEGYLKENTVLTNEQRKRLYDFYSPYGKVTDIFHRFYLEKTGVFSEKFLPVDMYVNYVDTHFNNRAEAKFLDNKCYYPKLFPGIPQPEFAVMRIGGFWYNNRMDIIDYSMVKDIVSNENELFLKTATDSFGGKGVMYISKEKGDMLKQFEDFGCRGDFVAQKPIKQHKDIAAINESSVNTIRIISLLKEDEVKIYSVIMRIGMKGSKVDNASSGGITIGVTSEGTLRKYAHKHCGDHFDTHPTNGFVFEGYNVPGIDKAKELVKKAHPMVPHFRLVSWDIAIEEEGAPVLLEANLCMGGIDIHEINNGPLFGDETKEILNEVFGKK